MGVMCRVFHKFVPEIPILTQSVGPAKWSGMGEGGVAGKQGAAAFMIGALEVGGVATELVVGRKHELYLMAAVPTGRTLHRAEAGRNVFQEVDEADGLAQGVGDVGPLFQT